MKRSCERNSAQDTDLHVLPHEKKNTAGKSPSEEKAEHTTISQVQEDTGLQQVVPLEENNEHTSISKIQNSEQQEASPSDEDADTIEDQDTNQNSMSSSEEGDEHTIISRIQDVG